MTRGRRSDFSDALAERMLKLYREGKTDRQVAARIGVSPRTIANWKGQHPDFLQSLKEANDVADNLVEASLFNRATGYTHREEKIFLWEGQVIRVPTLKHIPPDVTAQIFWLKNRRPEQWRNAERAEREDQEPKERQAIQVKTFAQFCETAGYPVPFEKQDEMRAFIVDDVDCVPRMLLGARGYGKTDYITILGVAYKLYRDPKYRTLILTKSKERNVAILKEIETALLKNGTTFDKSNSNYLRVTGLLGKDHSVSAVTIKTASLRGRHPDLTLLDDPVTEDDTSEATRKLVEKKWNEILKLTSNAAIIGQPAHKFDLYAKLRGMIKIMEVPHGTIPQLDHDLEAQRLAGVDEASIQASYFLTIKNEGSTPFDGIQYIDKFPEANSAIAFLDPSHKGVDLSALSILTGFGQGVAVVGFAWKRAWNHCLDDVVAQLVKFKVKKLAFETNGLGDQPVEILRGLLAPYGIGVIGRNSSTNKHARIVAAGTFSHQIHLSRESSKVYTDQVVQYEYNAKHDDAPDSLASCLEWIGFIRGKS